MRLIDADEFYDRVYNDTDLCAEMEVEGLTTLKKYLDLQATAYDIDKVVAELNELEVKAITRYKNGDFGDFDGVDYYIKKSEAIEIVKQGGVSDDACEWKDNGTYGYVTSCTEFRSRIAYKDTYWKYCPYCGKKIKVVE